MKIGLVRHFKVKHGYPKKWLNASELEEWFFAYDAADIEKKEANLGETSWQACYVSDMTRALNTAKEIYSGSIHIREDLREVSNPNFKKLSKRKLPFLIWAIHIRRSWLQNHDAHPEKRNEVQKRINQFLQYIEQQKEKEILVVSHGMFMLEMMEELKKQGFQGPKVRNPKNGELYVFEKNNHDKEVK